MAASPDVFAANHAGRLEVVEDLAVDAGLDVRRNRVEIPGVARAHLTFWGDNKGLHGGECFQCGECFLAERFAIHVVHVQNTNRSGLVCQ